MHATRAGRAFHHDRPEPVPSPPWPNRGWLPTDYRAERSSSAFGEEAEISPGHGPYNLFNHGVPPHVGVLRRRYTCRFAQKVHLLAMASRVGQGRLRIWAA